MAFIYAYSRDLSATRPREADMQRHFQVSPPSVHQMVLNSFERAGLHQADPGVARSIEILVEPEDLPVLR